MLLEETLQPSSNSVVPLTTAPIRPLRPANVAIVESPSNSAPNTPRPAIWLCGLSLVLIGWAFWPTLGYLVGKWANDPSYSHGFLVPLVAAFIVYKRSKGLSGWFSTSVPILGGLLFLGILGLRALAGGLLFNQLDAVSLILTIATATLTLGGWRLMKRCWSGLVFLIFAVPLPYEMEQNLGGPLKIIATQSSAYLLQTFGFPAITLGNTIHIDETQLEVIDACNGLKMLMTFAAFGIGAVLLLNRTRFEKFCIVLAIVPIAVLSNVLRITATGMLHTVVHDPKTMGLIHDWNGLMMMVVGLAFLALELWVLNNLIAKPKTAAV